MVPRRTTGESTTRRREETLDCVIVGGGPGGLSCALVLARACRTVIVVDDAKPRNAAARAVNSYLGLSGLPPHELRSRGRREVANHAGRFVDGVVTSARGASGAFVLDVAVRGGRSRTLRARRLLLATGVVDTFPPWQRFDDFYGRSVFHCADCDGYEMRGRRVVVAGDDRAADTARLLAAWTRDVTLLSARPPAPSVANALRRAGVHRAAGRVVGLRGRGRRLSAAVLSTGERVPCDAAFFSYGHRLRPGVHEDLRCRVDEKTCLVRTTPSGATSVRGVYAAGDMTHGSQLSIVAAAEGALAAIKIHRSLVRPRG
jgi:thioredoxin reductase